MVYARGSETIASMSMHVHVPYGHLLWHDICYKHNIMQKNRPVCLSVATLASIPSVVYCSLQGACASFYCSIYRVMMSLKRHFGHLRDHLLAMVAPLDRDSSDLDHVTSQLGDDLLSQLEDPETIDKVFETVNQCLMWVEPGRHKKKAEPPGGGERDVGRDSDDEEMEEERSGDTEEPRVMVVLWYLFACES